MEIQKMIKYIDEPIKMKEEALQDIKALLEKYPFFHTANLLFVKAAHNIQDELYNSEINKVSASIPNREILHELINLKEIQIVVEEKKDKPKESKTRSAIRKRIKERKLKRTSTKTPELLTSGKARHLSLIKDFFEPVLEKLVKNIDNYRVIIKNDILPVAKDEATSELSVEDKRARKKAEREKRLAEKRRLKAEESQGDDKDKRKAEREKRKAEREKRKAARIAGEKIETLAKEEVGIQENPILDDREKRKLERQKRKEEKEKEIAKQIAEKQNTDKTEEASTDKKTDTEDIKITVEKDTLNDREKRKLERQKRKEEKEKKLANNKMEKSKPSEKIDADDPYTKIISIPSSKNTENKEEKHINDKQKEVKETTTNIVKETQKDDKKEQVVESNDEIEDIFSKILNSKRQKPLAKEIKKEKPNAPTNKIDNKKEVKEVIDSAKKETIIIAEDKIDDIEFIVEDKTEKDKITKVETTNKPKDIVIDDNEEVFELIENKEDKDKLEKKEEPKPKTEDKNKKKAANSVFDKIAAYKSKKGATSKIKKDVEKKEEVILKEEKNKKDTHTKEVKVEVPLEDVKKEITEKKVVKKEVDIELSVDDNNLIDKFVLGKPAMKRPTIEDEKENIDISKESTKIKKPVITELMASIYVNQAKYNQAIEIYEQLILKNPEKKDYFASKIKETENLK